MRILILTFLCFLIFNELPSQNLIPNGSFELVKKPIDEKITGSRAGFDNKVHAWYCPTEVSPDIYQPHPNNANFPDHFKLPEKKEGNNYIGLVIDYPYHVCKNYREYVQVKLKDTLKIGTTYLLEFWLSSRETDKFTLGIFFGKDKLVNDKCSVLLHTPQLSFKDSLTRWEWRKVSYEITPSQPYAYITVGNFEETNTRKSRYCYFDNFRLWKKGTIIEKAYADSLIVEKQKQTIEYTTTPLPHVTSKVNDIPPPVSPTIEKVFNGKNIQFKHGKYNLTQSSLLELDQLISHLIEHPNLKVLIEGHTE